MTKTIKIKSLNTKNTQKKKKGFDDALLKLGVTKKSGNKKEEVKEPNPA